MVAVQEEPAPLRRPFAELVTACDKFFIDPFNAGHLECRVLVVKPSPIAWADVESVVLVFGSDENICIKQVPSHVTPSRSASAYSVDDFLKPSIWNASV